MKPALPRDFWTHFPEHLVEGSLWLRVGFVALCIVASSLVVLAEGGVAAWKALAWALSAAVASYFAFRRSWILINRTEPTNAGREASRAAVARAATN